MFTIINSVILLVYLLWFYHSPQNHCLLQQAFEGQVELYLFLRAQGPHSAFGFATGLEK